MPSRVRVSGGVAVWSVVAAAHVTAFRADPQVKPFLASGQAIRTSIDSFRELSDLDVSAVPAQDHVRARFLAVSDAVIA